MKRSINSFLLTFFFAVIFLSAIYLPAAQADKLTANYYADGKKQSADVEVQVNDKYLYGYLPDNSIVILMYYGKNKSVDIQKDFGDAIVTSINANAFNVFADPYEIDDKFYQVDHGLEHVIVPSTVSYLGEYWFYVHKWSNSATYNNLPNGLKYADQNSLNYIKIDSIPLWSDIYIAENNFSPISVPSKTLTISDDYISIPKGWFGRISANKVILPKNLEKIEMFCLNTNDGITELVLPDHLQEIGSFSFNRWTKLKKIWIPASLKSIGEECFSDAPIEEVVFMEGIEKIDFSFLRHVNTLKKISLPSTLKVIESRCFLATGLTNLELPFGTETIKEAAFKDCNKLATVRLPGSLTSIADDAFEGCLEKCIFTVDINSYAEKWANEKGYKTKVIIPVTDISLDINTVILNKGKSQTLKAAIAPDNSTDKKVEWISSDPAIATVNNGNIKAVACGECDITCRAIDGSGVQAVCHVSVIQMVQNIQAKDKKITIPFGATYQPEITIKPDDATNRVLSWTSSDESVCKVDANGLITAVHAGDCEISAATTDGSSKLITLAVHVPIFDNMESDWLVTQKDGLLIPINFHGFPYLNVSLKSDNDKAFLANLDSDGVHVFPVSKGKGTITLSSNQNKADIIKLNVSVDESALRNENDPLSVIIVTDSNSINTNEQYTVKYHISGGKAPYQILSCKAIQFDQYDLGNVGYSYNAKSLPSGNLKMNNPADIIKLMVKDSNGTVVEGISQKLITNKLNISLDRNYIILPKNVEKEIPFSIAGGSGSYKVSVEWYAYFGDNYVPDYKSINLESDSHGVITNFPEGYDAFYLVITATDKSNRKLTGRYQSPTIAIDGNKELYYECDKYSAVPGETVNLSLTATNVDPAQFETTATQFIYSAKSGEMLNTTNNLVWKKSGNKYVASYIVHDCDRVVIRMNGKRSNFYNESGAIISVQLSENK